MQKSLGKCTVAAMTRGMRLVGDGVENPANARALMDAAAMFGASCCFRDTRGLARAWDSERGGVLELIDTPELIDRLRPMVVVENTPEATIVFGATLPASQSSVVVGGERLGVRADLLRAAARTVQIPMSGRGVNTLNVAASGAVALYYLLAGRGLGLRLAKRPEERRPALLLSGPSDHVEAGSAIRSAAAFGWRMVGLADTQRVWFGVSRGVTTEGRAAARSHRNFIRVAPMRAGPQLGFRRVVLAGAHIDGPPIHRVDITGRDTLLVIPDEEEQRDRSLGDLGGSVHLARVDLPVPAFPYRYRLTASIVIAEAARQTGFRPVGRRRLPARRGLSYESALVTSAGGVADEVSLSDLKAY
jgi:tRNA G18 (ribose-2'-O)-methylase SpoU